jgi:hypothetical protein
MARPWKHPSTGIYWLRKRVPAELRPLVGKTEEKQSLRTRDPAAAKVLHSEALLELERRWSNLRQPKRTISEREAHQLAASVHDGYLARYAENPSEQTAWDVEVGRELWVPRGALPHHALLRSDDHRKLAKVTRVEMMCRRQAEGILGELGISADETGLHNLEVAIARALQNAAVELQRRANGHWPISDDGPATDRAHAEGKSEAAKEPLTFEIVFNGWAAEKQPAAKTRYAWRRTLDDLATFIGHTDAPPAKGRGFDPLERVAHRG